MHRQGIRPDDPLTAELPFVGVENVAGGTGLLNFDTDSRIGDQKSTAFRFDPRHVLYGKLRPYLNKVAVPDFAGRCSTELVPLLPRDGVDRDFLAHLLRRKETVEFVMASVTGARMPRTDMKVLMSMPVPFPPLDEQRRIAGILNQAAKIERLRAQTTVRLHNFTSALFIKMFGDSVENPKGWPVVQIGDVAGQGQYGLNAPSTTQADGIRFIRITDIDDNGELIKNRKVFVDSTIANLYKYELVPDDILIARSGATSGKSYLHRDIGEQSIFAGYLIRFRVVEKIKLLPLYLFNFLHTKEYWRQIRAKKRTAAQPNVNAKELASILFPLPPIDEQKRFVDIIDHVFRINAIYQGTSISPSLLSASLIDRLLEGNPTS